MAGKVKQFLDHVVPAVIKPLRVLWNEVIAFLFLLFGLIPLPGAWQAWRQIEEKGEGFFRLGLTLIFSITMLSFGLSSFLRARKISRS